jgi:hypothetical protein
MVALAESVGETKVQSVMAIRPSVCVVGVGELVTARGSRVRARSRSTTAVSAALRAASSVPGCLVAAFQSVRQTVAAAASSGEKDVVVDGFAEVDGLVVAFA